MFQTGPIGSVGISSALSFITPTSAQSLAFLNRTSGLNPTWWAAYDALITGLVNDGVWTKLDALYAFRSQNQATANLNLISSSFAATLQAPNPTFAPSVGYTGNGSGYIHTSFNPATAPSPNYASASATIGGYVSSLGIDVTVIPLFGASDGTTRSLLDVGNNGGTQLFRMNSGAQGPAGPASPLGLWTVSRTGVSAMASYQNASVFASSSLGATGSVPNSEVLFLNDANGNVADLTIQAGFIGGALTGTDVANLNSRLATFLAT